MSAYRVRAPLPAGVPVARVVEAEVRVGEPSASGWGRLEVHSPDPRFAAAVQARLRRCYGFRGGQLGDRLTQDDLHCAMRCPAMAELAPRWVA